MKCPRSIRFIVHAESCLKQYFLRENNNSSSVPGFSRVKLPIIILSRVHLPLQGKLSVIMLLPVAFPVSNVTTSNASSAHGGSDSGGKMAGCVLSGGLLILLFSFSLQVVGQKERDTEVVLVLSPGKLQSMGTIGFVWKRPLKIH